MHLAAGGKKFKPLSNNHAYIALGSNIGDRVSNIEQACRELDNDGLRVTRTSGLYETAPMYLTDQDQFINGVCEVRTDSISSPVELLRRLKAIEQRMGREKTIEKGPRNIDLDILLQGQQVFESAELTVPHRDMLEREFVLRPLSDLIPDTSHPGLPGFSYGRRLAQFECGNESDPMSNITMLTPRIQSLTPTVANRETLLMGVLNITPDSFSDGGLHSAEPDSLLLVCQSLRSAGASIIDIGGQSTRPRALQIEAEEEAARVLPIIRLLRSLPEFDQVALSIDTYRATVARAAVVAGADIVNDVSGGLLDPHMLPTLAELGCGVVLMHMRGDPDSMVKQTDYSRYGGVIPGVAAELVERVEAAERAGIRRWRIALDPGIGFAKTSSQNLELLGNLAEFRAKAEFKGFPWLVGPSRKSFIGKITGVTEPKDRTWGTAAAITAAVQGGADMVRVHDVAEMRQVVRVADAIWRTPARRA